MIRLPEEVKKIMGETEGQRLSSPIKALRLPCSNAHKYKEPSYVQIMRPEDQTVICPMCGKKHYLIWSKLENHRFT